MKKPRTEITNESAKFVLNAYRPNGADAQDPVFRDALEQAAPLLCAGIIGFRCLRLSGIKPGGRLGFYGFGAAAHVAIQVARFWNVAVYASTRDARHQKLALALGAAWAGVVLGEAL